MLNRISWLNVTIGVGGGFRDIPFYGKKLASLAAPFRKKQTDAYHSPLDAGEVRVIHFPVVVLAEPQRAIMLISPLLKGWL